jgi:hypothetical protein
LLTTSIPELNLPLELFVPGVCACRNGTLTDIYSHWAEVS